jgi:uncharacterized membrane protein
MWIRKELKDRAKQTLRKYYWVALLVAFVTAAVGGYAMGAPSIGYRYQFGNYHPQPYHFNGMTFDNGFFPAFAAVIAVIAAFAALFGLIALAICAAYKIFVAGPAAIGMRRYFLEARQDRSEPGNLFYAFHRGQYGNAVKATAWRVLFTFLWTLLFIIPGIVKCYAYSMIPYIMADNPKMEYKRAMTLSMAMTKGHKWKIFVLDLSFFGWGILGLLCCGIGIAFLAPYIAATKAEMYVVLRRNAMEAGIGTTEEFGQNAVPELAQA